MQSWRLGALHGVLGLPNRRLVSRRMMRKPWLWRIYITTMPLRKLLRGLQCRLTIRSSSFVLPELKRDYPLNLSISVSGGKETNKDSASNGE